MSTRFAGRVPFRLALCLVIALCVGAAVTTVRSQDDHPEAHSAHEPADGVSAQPIAFSHQHHVSDVGLDCQFCHTYARRSPTAGIPSVERCVGCHATVLSDRPEVQKILNYWDKQEPIPWLRVHDLPDHVRFTHKRHVRGGVSCQTCHGDVGQMEHAEQVESLSMGWCVTCHEERDASRDCLTCHY